jgi:hypothetical protein
MQTCSSGLVAPIAPAPASAQAPASLLVLAPVLPPGKGWGPAPEGPTSPIALDGQAGRAEAGALAIARPCSGRLLQGM